MNATIEISFRTPGGRPISYRDLGEDFVNANNVAASQDDEFVVTVDAQTSKAGNLYYAWDLSAIPLPDGFATQLAINGVALRPGLVGESKNGNPMRKDEGEIEISGLQYKVSGLVVKTRRPYWVKVIAHKKPSRKKNG